MSKRKAAHNSFFCLYGMGEPALLVQLSFSASVLSCTACLESVC